LNIETGCEGTVACAGEDYGANRGVVRELFEDGGEVEPHADGCQPFPIIVLFLMVDSFWMTDRNLTNLKTSYQGSLDQHGCRVEPRSGLASRWNFTAACDGFG
jgi:hypothetical protein